MKYIPTGIEDFKELMDRNYYYVDKTMLIKDIIGEKVVLYTRPRRFGKSLNMSMLNYYYNIKEKENAYVFEGLQIAKDEEAKQHQNKYPLIYLTLKEMRYLTFQEQKRYFNELIVEILVTYEEILTSSKLSEIEKRRLSQYIEEEADLVQLSRSIYYVSTCLEKHYGEKVMILIDEYDVPLQYAYTHGYYEEMVNFLRNVFSAALKTNHSLYQGILTGCLQIAKESIFTGMNNFKVNSIFSNDGSSRFGFIPKEVEEMLSYYDLQDRKGEVAKWYDGYLFGKQEIYNPWSTNMYIDAQLNNEGYSGISYWANTSGNDIVMKYMKQGTNEMKQEFDVLINQGSIIKKITPEITYREMDNVNHIYSFLLFTGYLKVKKVISRSDDIYEIEIPNEEVRKVYINQFEVVFKEYTNTQKGILLQYLQNEEAIEANNVLNDILERCISYYDNKESFYHGLLLGIFSEYEVISNEEAENGRLDIAIKPKDIRGKVVIIECKHARSEDDLVEESEVAISQIKEKGYMNKKAYQRYGGVVG